ncbi:hypothetical protein BAOM_1262 [Peribacillus asahii]|uniref:Uncharacterized protein n=1 Tax=Peribacillus asahii TaxID=228899 RepID=A0A3Q9RM08_9BACI|nr:hypothetical protein BAOM_1262 [Peribacillus asahii]
MFSFQRTSYIPNGTILNAWCTERIFDILSAQRIGANVHSIPKGGASAP